LKTSKVPKEGLHRQEVIREMETLKTKYREISVTTLFNEEHLAARKKVSSEGRDKIFEQTCFFANQKQTLTGRETALDRHLASIESQERAYGQDLLKRFQDQESRYVSACNQHDLLMKRKAAALAKQIEEISHMEAEKDERMKADIERMDQEMTKVKEGFKERKRLIERQKKESNEAILSLIDETRGVHSDEVNRVQRIENELKGTVKEIQFIQAMNLGLRHDSQREMNVLQESGDELQRSLRKQALNKEEDEITTLKRVLDALERDQAAAEKRREDRLKSASKELVEETNHMSSFLESLIQAVQWLDNLMSALSQLMADERKILDERKKKTGHEFDEDKGKLHTKINKERQRMAGSIAKINGKIQHAREQREQMTVGFHQEVSDFTQSTVDTGTVASMQRRLKSCLEAKVDHLIMKRDEITAKLRYVRERHAEKLRQQARDKDAQLLELRKTCAELKRKLG